MMAVSQGKRPSMKKKELLHVPVGFVELMKRCWATHSKRRPTFVDIVKQLNVIMNNLLILHLPVPEPVKEVLTPFELENPLNCVSPWSDSRLSMLGLVKAEDLPIQSKNSKKRRLSSREFMKQNSGEVKNTDVELTAVSVKSGSTYKASDGTVFTHR